MRAISREDGFGWINHQNTAARRFYERHGFVPLAYTDGADNEENRPDVLYEWPAMP